MLNVSTVPITFNIDGGWQLQPHFSHSHVITPHQVYRSFSSRGVNLQVDKDGTHVNRMIEKLITAWLIALVSCNEVCQFATRPSKCVEIGDQCHMKALEYTNGINEGSRVKVACRQHYRLNLRVDAHCVWINQSTILSCLKLMQKLHQYVHRYKAP